MTQEGEKEIVLGNKQLISLFFIVVALLGVFFAAGYMIGRRSAPPGAGAAVSDAGNAAPQTSPAPVAVEEKPAQPDPGPGSIAQSEPETHAPAKSTDTAVTKPEAGATYLQVTALRRPDADNLVRSLQEQSFPVMLAESSKEGLYRVLVGPYYETAKVAESKGRLKALGFANAFVQK